MGKVMIISFDGSEETVMDKIYSALVEEGFETTAIEKTSNLSFSEIQIYVKEKKVFAHGTEVTLSYHEFFTFLKIRYIEKVLMVCYILHEVMKWNFVY